MTGLGMPVERGTAFWIVDEFDGSRQTDMGRPIGGGKEKLDAGLALELGHLA